MWITTSFIRKKPCRGNQGPGLTGSNGNAGPISGEGLPIDPAAETYKKQVGGTSCLGLKSLIQIGRNIPFRDNFCVQFSSVPDPVFLSEY
jgi:hypothetical protein